MQKLAGLSAMTLLACAPLAAEAPVFENWEIDLSADTTIALSPGRSDAGPRESEPVLGHVGAELRLDRVLQNGAEIGVRIGARAQADHPDRQGFSGQIGDAGSGPMLVLRGAFTGLSTGGTADGDGIDIELETAFAYIDGGYGELLAGRDIGIARRFHAGPESVFRFHNGVNASLDTSGIGTVLTRNDLTGPSFKVSYATPRLVGVRLGASWTPDANTGGVDRDPQSSVSGIAEPRLSNAVEIAVNATRLLRGPGVRVTGYGAYGRADIDLVPVRQDFGTVEVWSLGGFLERDGLSFGADWLTTDNAGGRYRAWSVGLGADRFGLKWSGGFGHSDDDLTGIDGETWHFGASRTFAERVTLSVGLDQNRISSNGGLSQASIGPVIEITLRQ